MLHFKAKYVWLGWKLLKYYITYKWVFFPIRKIFMRKKNNQKQTLLLALHWAKINLRSVAFIPPNRRPIIWSGMFVIIIITITVLQYKKLYYSLVLHGSFTVYHYQLFGIINLLSLNLALSWIPVETLSLWATSLFAFIFWCWRVSFARVKLNCLCWILS